MKLIAVLVVVETTLLLLSRVDTEISYRKKSGYVDTSFIAPCCQPQIVCY